MNATTLVDTYRSCSRSKTKMAGWKRNLTAYCRRRENETGTPDYRYKAAIKSVLTKKGCKVTNI